jgi:PTS system beta-glucosides-specific IIC component
MADKKQEELARDIIENIGGEENVDNLRHCITRLRFNLKDEGKANTDYLKKRDGVVTVVQSSGQYQVVIGNEVAEVYEAITEVSGIGSEGSSGGSGNNEQDDRNLLDKFIDFISGIFQPFLMALAATGMIKGVTALLATIGVDQNSGLYQILNFAGDGFFQFLPIMVAITAARSFKMNQFTGLAIAAAFLHPSLSVLAEGEVLYTLFEGTAFASPITSTFLGIPIILPAAGNYYSAIIPIILAVWFGSYIEKWFKKVIPSVVRSFLVPFFTVIITVPIALIVIGPIASWAAALIGLIFTELLEFSPLLFGALLAASWQLLVVFGLHWGIIPITYVLLAEQGINPMGPAMQVSVFGVLGVVIALVIKSNEKQVKNIGIPGIISLFFGISEPVIYGLMLPMKRSFLYAIIGNIVGGAYLGVTNTVAYRTGGLGVFSIFNAIDPNGEITMNFWNNIIGFILAIAVGLILQMIMPLPAIAGNDSEETIEESDNNTGAATNKELQESAKQEIIGSPVTGEIVAQEDIEDEVFASGAMGQAIAVNPTDGTVYAPANGIVTTIFPTGHAIGLTTDDGTEILIHIGLDTVELDGEGFEKFVEADDKVEAGQKLISFDIDLINDRGFSTQTPIVVTNSNEFEDVLFTDETSIEPGDYLLTSVK